MFIIPSIDLSMKLSLSEVFVSNIIVTMVISNKSCCKHVLFTNLSDFISTTTRVTSLKSKKFLFCSFSVAKFGIAPMKVVFFSVNRSWRQQEARINLRFTNFSRGQKFLGLPPPAGVKSRERVRATISDANSWLKGLCTPIISAVLQ